MPENVNKPKPEDSSAAEQKRDQKHQDVVPGAGGSAAQAALCKTPVPASCPGSIEVSTAQAEKAGAETQPLAGVVVRIDSVGATPAFHDLRTTGESGTIQWPVAPGEYKVELTPPSGYSVISLPAKDKVTVGENQTVCVEAVFSAPAAEIHGCLFYDANGSRDPSGQASVPGRVLFFRNNQRIGCVTTTDGNFIERFTQTGLVEVRPDDSYQSGGQELHHPFQAPLYVNLRPGSSQTVCIPLYPARAFISASACVMHKGQKQPLRGARFLLHRGTDTSRAPVSADVFDGQAVRWTDLEPEFYTITALPPDTAMAKRLRPAYPPDGRMTVQLTEGHNDLRDAFCYEACIEKAAVRVVRDNCGTALAGVDIDFIDEQTGAVQTVTTSADGIASIDADPTVYLVRASTTKFFADNAAWDIDKVDLRIDMRGYRPAQPGVLRARQEQHGVRCVIQDENGQVRSFAAVQILDETGAVVKEANTNAQGELNEQLPRAGNYTMVILPQIQRVSFETQSVANLGVIRSAAGPPGGRGTGGPLSGVAEAFGDLTSYPLLTEGTGGGGGNGGRMRRPSGVSSVSRSSFGYTVEGAIREVLGWRPKAGDTRGFAEALTRSFESTEVGGKTHWSWTPRSAALVVDSELGAITGAQKSIYERGRVALDQARPLLDAIYPLRNDSDPENCDSVRYIVTTAFEDLVREFGQSGGPRVQLVDEKFNLLLGTSNLNVTDQLDRVCQLAVFRDRFGMLRTNVNTIAEEENLTNFLIVVDHLKSLRITWNNNFQFFDRSGSNPFLGTQLVLLSRALGNVAEGVDEVRYVLGTVLLDDAEQQTVLIEVPGQTPIFISELLSWVEHVATVEGPQLLQESGRDGAAALRNTLLTLRGLVTSAQNPSNAVPSAYRTQRVQRALQELALALHETARLAVV